MGSGNSATQQQGPLGADGWRTWAGAGLLALTAFLAYANTFSVPLILDDWITIRDNPHIRHLWPLSEVFAPAETTGVGGRPIANLSFVLNNVVSGGSLAGYHVMNLAIHICAGLALYGVIRRTLLLPRWAERFGRDVPWLAPGLAALWLLHPIQTESVTYISQRTEELMGCFYFTTLYCFIRVIDSGRWWWRVLAMVACGAGTATKEGMVTLPVIALLYDYAFVTRSFREALRRRWPLYLGFAMWWPVLLGLMRGLHGRGVGFGLGTSPFGYALTECRAIATYAGLGIWPARLVFDYGTNLGEMVIGLGGAVPVVIGLILFAAVALWRWPVAGFLAAWFIITLSPTSSVVPIPLQPVAENRVYLPLAGTAVAIGIGIYGRIARRIAAPVLAAIGLAFAVGTFARNHDYRNEVSIWADTAAKMPRSARAHNNLAQALHQAGRIDQAKAEYESALKLKPDYPDARANLASLWGVLGRNDLAIEEARRALEFDPGHFYAHYNLGIALIHAERPAEALTELQAVIRARPDYAGAHSWLAWALLQLSRPADALAEAQTARRLNPESIEAQYREGVALTHLGRPAEAIPLFESVTRAVRDNADGFYALGTALINAGRASDAVASLESAVRLNPRFALARSNLGVALAANNRLPEALKEFEIAAELDPTLVAARDNRDKIRAQIEKGTGK